MADRSQQFSAALLSMEDQGRRHEVASGHVLFERGERGESMYLVESGAVELRFDHTSKRVGPGGFFGELAVLFGGHDRTATAVAVEKCSLLEFDQRTFSRMLDEAPALLIDVLSHSCRMLLESERVLMKDLLHQNRSLHETLMRLQKTERRLSDAELAAHTDGLTGLFNRRFLDGQIEHFLLGVRKRSSATSLALLLFDLDDFKSINDTYGHAAGDRALRAISTLLQDNLRPGDLPYRIGGDEFAVLLFDIESPAAAARAAQIHERVGCFDVTIDDRTTAVTASVGGAFHRAGETWQALFDRADANLYRAKQEGAGSLVWEGGGVPTSGGRFNG